MTIRVLHCIARMNAGGTATLLDGLMSQMDPSVEQLLVYGKCERNEIDFMKDRLVTYPNVFVESLSRSINPLRDLKAFLVIRNLAKEFRPSVIHSHTFKAGLLGRAAALTIFPRPKIVHTFHGHLLTGYFSPVITKLISLIERLLAQFTNVLVTVGPEVTSDLLRARIGKSKQYRLILPGAADPVIIPKNEAQKALGLKSGLFTIGFVGRLTKVKRIDRFLDALANLDISYQAFVAGDGEEKEGAIDQSRRKNLPVLFLGWREDIDTLFSSADVIVLTSDNEGFGLVLGEAQLRGTPVIATNVGSVQAALVNEKTGFLVPPDSGAIAVAISNLAHLSQEEYKKMSEAAKVFANATFSMERFAREHSHLYRELSNE